jgi:hypothetical protein
MSFDTEKIKPSSKKIVLVEIDKPVIVDHLINHEAGIWETTLYTTTTVLGSDLEIGYYGDINSTIEYNNIKSCKVDGVNYTQVFSLADLRLQNEGFYFDKANQKVYFHFNNWEQPLDKKISVGQVEGYCDKVDQVRADGCYYNDIYYAPRVLSLPSFSKKKDSNFFGVIQYQGGTIVIDNTDSDDNFDDVNDFDIFGQPIRVFFGFEGFEYNEYKQLIQGYIEDYDIDESKFKINFQDYRKQLSREIPIRQFSQTDYPYLADDLVNTYKPLAWGYVRGRAAICLNQYEAEPFQFMFVDTTDHDATELIMVYVNGIEKTPSNVDLTAGTFELSDVQVDDNFDDVTCDFIGFDVSDSGQYANGFDVIVDIIEIYDNIPFLTSNYNDADWFIARAAGRDVGLYVIEPTQIIELIGKITDACDGIFFFQGDGKRTARVYSASRAITKTIQSDEWLKGSFIKKHPSTEYLTSVIIKYNENESNDNDNTKYKQILNNTYEDEVFNIYKKYQQKTFPTILAWEVDAVAKAENIMSFSKIIPEIVTRKTASQNIDLEIMDFVVAEHNRQSDTTKDWKVYEILGIRPDPLKAEVTLTMKEIRDYT